MLGFREGYDQKNRRIGEAVVDVNGMKYWVSTVDLGIDHSFGGGPPLYWETMIFSCDSDGNVTNWGERYCERYSSKEAAIDGHANAVKNCGELIK